MKAAVDSNVAYIADNGEGANNNYDVQTLSAPTLLGGYETGDYELSFCGCCCLCVCR